jgi:hypothetical protein
MAIVNNVDSAAFALSATVESVALAVCNKQFVSQSRV